MTTKPDTPPTSTPGRVPIRIDGEQYVAPHREVTGAQLRALAEPPIGADRDLWLDVDGGLDQLVLDDQIVELRPQTQFFTVPKVINPGALR